VYDERAEAACSASQGQAIAPEWVAELRSRLPEFRALWQSVGPRMIRTASALTRKPFAPVGPVRLKLCKLPSNAFFGPLVNMRFALRSFAKSPVALRYKVDTALHELLHEFVARNTPADSRLLAAHSSEPVCVRNHLHLLALQKAVLLELGDGPSLDQVVAVDSQLPSACYRRAWALVNETEAAYKPFVEELSR
jgi:hypothetical protein